MSYKINDMNLCTIFKEIVVLTIESNIVIQADPELTLDFFENILKGLSVGHDTTTGTIKLYLQL